MPEPTLKERLTRRLEGLKGARQSYEADAREIASLAMPSRSRFLATGANKARQTNRKMNSAHGIRAFRTLQGGMTSGLSSESRPWFNLQTLDENINEDPEVRAYLSEVERRLYAFLAKTNFYGAVKTGYLELGGFGTEACIMFEHPTEGAVCHQLTFGEYWLALGSALTPEALYRECAMTALQAVQRFGYDNVAGRVQTFYDRGSYEEIVVYWNAIEKNDELDEGRLDWRGKAWRSVYWDASDDNKDRVTQKTGFEEQPFWAPRWDTTGADIWGQGPGHDALPDLRELQMQAKRKGEATDMHIWPEIVSSSKIKLKRQPKSVVSSAEVDVGKLVTVPYQVPYEAIASIREDIGEIKQAIDEITYADLFMAITNMRGVQPRNIEEIAARNEEKLTQLGPVIERVNNEKLEVAIERAFGIMQRSRMLPPPPEALANAPDLKIEFVSILTQMQRMVGLGQIERTVGFIGAQAAVFPEALDKLNIDEAIDEYANRAGTPPKLIRTAEQVEEIRDQRAQQENIERVLAAAPAAKDGAQAAALMAEVGQDALPMGGAMPL
jgi:hypothetical protein